MNLFNTAEYNLEFFRRTSEACVVGFPFERLGAVGVFYFLNTYTRRRYFTIWTTAWLFYALWLTLNFFGAIRFARIVVADLAQGVVPVCFGALFTLGQLAIPGTARQTKTYRPELGLPRRVELRGQLPHWQVRAEIHWSVFILSAWSVC